MQLKQIIVHCRPQDIPILNELKGIELRYQYCDGDSDAREWGKLIYGNTIIKFFVYVEEVIEYKIKKFEK